MFCSISLAVGQVVRTCMACGLSLLVYINMGRGLPGPEHTTIDKQLWRFCPNLAQVAGKLHKLQHEISIDVIDLFVLQGKQHNRV